MKDYYSRTLTLANYILKHKTTIRKTAEVFGMAKSTVHYDLTNRLPYVSRALFEEVKALLDLNFNEKHLRGGQATRKKYLSKNQNKKVTT